MAKFIVPSDQMDGIVGKCLEIQRLARLDGGSPWEPDAMNKALQLIVEGKFPGAQGVQVTQPVQPSRILKPVATVDVPAVKRYSLRETLKAGAVIDGIKVAYVDPDIFAVFGDLVETDVPAATVRISQLTKGSTDIPIIAELGGEEVAITTWAHDWEVLKPQGQGQRGRLLTNGYANLSYKRAEGKVWVLNRDLHDDGWSFLLYSSSFPHGWNVGRQVVSG